jgi:hypothetical protein
MGVPYTILVRNVAVRINALTGATQPAELETAYTITPLTAGDVQESSIFPFSAIQDAVLLAEQKLAQTIAETKDHAWRAVLISQTDELANNATLPAQDENGLSIIGVYGDVFDSTNERVLSEQPVEVIQRRLNTPALWKIPVYHFAMTGDSIVHTRTNVRIEVCVWDYLNQEAAIQANDDMLLPDVLEEAIICGAITMLVRDDEWLAQGSQYATYFTESLAAIKAGQTVAARAA